jgi:AraC-like DNA-binding protein
VNPHFEKVLANEGSFLVFERVEAVFPFYWHYHPEFELTLIVEGHGQRLVGGSVAEYAPGDLVLLGPNIPHSWRSRPYLRAAETPHRAIVVQFKADFLGERFFELHEMQPVAQLLKRAESGLSFGSPRAEGKLRSMLQLPVAERLLLLLSVLLDLAEEPIAQPLLNERIRPMCRVADRKRLETICSYLNEHFDEKINFISLSESVAMDQASLCRFFKRATGRTMTEYVNEIRVGAAAQLLTSTDEKLLDIGSRVGFENYSHFNRQFRRLKGYTPGSLRRTFLSSAPLSIADRPK